MADVYLGRPRGQHRLVAIKCMKEKLAQQQAFIDMFVQEGNLAVRLNHETIVKTFEVGTVRGLYFICMEFIGGVDLSDVLRKSRGGTNRLPVPHAVYIAIRALEGLHYAHELRDSSGQPLNLVNRDVSPSNIRISFDGDVKLLDFGIAKATSGLTSEIGTLKGKLSHMSPEQVRGLPLDRRSDVFSTAIALHEMLTVQRLFRGESEFETMDLVRRADFRLPSTINRRVPKELDAVLVRGLKKMPADRYQTADEMAQDLKAVLAPYNFAKHELQDLLRETFSEEFRKAESMVLMAKSAEMPMVDVDEEGGDYGELFVDITYAPEVSESKDQKTAAKHSPWMYAVFVVAAVLLILAFVLVLM